MEENREQLQPFAQPPVLPAERPARNMISKLALALSIAAFTVSLVALAEQSSPPGNREVASGEQSLFEAPSDLPSFINNTSKSLVDIYCGDNGGTGFAFDLDPAYLRSGFTTHVITNHHVIEECMESNTELEVYIGPDYKIETIAIVHSADKENDLALLMVVADLPTIIQAHDFAESGWWSMAIGHPIDSSIDTVLYNATTFGQIIGVVKGYYNYTSAIINPGNSGGPLVNSRGELIGINSYAEVSQDKGVWNIAVDSDILCKKLIECDV